MRSPWVCWRQGAGDCNLNPYVLHFLHPRLFSKWQRTSSLTWVSVLSSMLSCGVGVEAGDLGMRGGSPACSHHRPPCFSLPQTTSLSCFRRSLQRPETSAMLRCE